MDLFLSYDGTREEPDPAVYGVIDWSSVIV